MAATKVGSISMDVDPSGSPMWPALLRASALQCFLPALCSTVKLKEARVCNHRSSMPVGCSMVEIYLRASWSVRKTNGRHIK